MNYWILALIPLVLSFGIVPAFAENISVTIPEGTSVSGCETSNECYIPYEITIDVGDKITWLNEDMAFHTVTSGNSVDGAHDLFDSGMFKLGEEYSREFDESGNFSYFCTLHPWMEGVVIVQEASAEDGTEDSEGGCLIATAAYGTELAPQVQFLREIRDNTVMSTASGASFMTGFNQLYYSFSPTIADWQRENPMFQEAVRVFITPMISTLSIMILAEDGSEMEIIGLGISVIALNIGMYVAAPAIGIWQIKKRI